MMLKRRTFLNKALLSSIGLSLGCLPAEEHNDNNKQSKGQTIIKAPLVISTWNRSYATQKAIDFLNAGKSALDAVEAGVMEVEANPKDQTVGYGGLPDRDGNVTLDACIMDHEGNAGSVTYLQNIKHPISVARRVMEATPHVMLSGDGALQFAKAQGFLEENLLTPNAEKAWRKWLEKKEYEPKVNVERHDTIGMLALDAQGRLAGACTTSGLAFKLPGRVGDSPIIGAGLFVDNEVGAACATGLGEMVLRTLGSFLIVEFMRQGASPQEACQKAVARVLAKHQNLDYEYQVGFVAVSNKGEIGAFSVRKGFNFTLHTSDKHDIVESKFLV